MAQTAIHRPVAPPASNMETVPRHLDALLLDPWFSQLPEALRKQIVAMGIVRKAVPRQKLFERGERNTGVFCLLEGTVLVMNEAEPGMEGVLVHFDPPAWFGEIGLFDGGPHTHTVLAATACSLLHLPRNLVLRLIEQTPEYWQHFSMLLAAKRRLASFAFDEFVKMPLEVRLRCRRPRSARCSSPSCCSVRSDRSSRRKLRHAGPSSATRPSSWMPRSA